jgi:hypothetical protein
MKGSVLAASLGWVLCAAVAAEACGGDPARTFENSTGGAPAAGGADTTGGAPAAGGGDASGGAENTDTVCGRVCEVGSSLDCPGSAERAECVSSCNLMRDSLYLCTVEFDEYTDCVAVQPETSFECASAGPVLMTDACAAESDAADACVTEYYSLLCDNGIEYLRETKVCDGIEDCSDGSDEASCILCNDGIEYVLVARVCDGIENCSDGSDEVGCYFCDDGVELVLTDFCDGYADCVDGTDEANCYQCDDGVGLVLGTQICDGIENCWDGSDEVDC